jgi:hypothetical protein
MNETVRGLVLLASVLLWLPFLRPTLDGGLTLEQGLVRYGCALLFAWAAGSGLNALVRGYSAQTAARTAEVEREEAAQQRRAQDRAAAEQVRAED